MNKGIFFIVPVIGLFTIASCMKPYDAPEYQEIDTSETGFLIPLEGDGTAQAKFASEKYLDEKKVAAKRVQIVHRWNKTGRTYANGKWIPTVRLVKVKRSPITRQWTAETSTGTASSNQAIWTESKDSVSFSMGFTCTSLIREEDAARFLYFYPSGSLADVMDSEVRARVQKTASEIAAKYNLDELRGRKQEIIDAVATDIVAFFADRGITVTTAGMFGGMEYQNPQIQKAIDETFIAQQEKDLANSRLLAQQKENERIEMQADATAQRTRREAQGEADAKLLLAKADAESIREINRALGESAQNPMVLQLKTLEVEKERIGRWDGQYPMYFIGSGSVPGLMMQMPVPAATTRASR